jgi:hypothetical protein
MLIQEPEFLDSERHLKTDLPVKGVVPGKMTKTPKNPFLKNKKWVKAGTGNWRIGGRDVPLCLCVKGDSLAR